jgi:hypothetical protein
MPISEEFERRNRIWERDRPIVDEMLMRGVRDWVHVAEFTTVVKQAGLNHPEMIRSAALGVMVEMMVRRLMIPGGVSEFGLQPWIEDFGDSIVRIVETWAPAELSPTPGAVCWFQLTDEGKRLGRELLAREQSGS